jgi:D-alanyl-D-alanine carboxypeptidase
MMTATACALVIAIGGILFGKVIIQKVFQISGNQASIIQAQFEAQTLASDINTALIEEADQDPSFVSRFSRVFFYSADSGLEIIENAKDSLPKSSSKKVTANAYSVIDLDQNITILEKNEEKLLPIASITKLVTAVVAKKLINKNQYITITNKALSTYGNEAWFREGEKMKVDELLYPLLMVSSNDAGEVLAGSYSKGRTAFIKEMNTWVYNIGAYHTYFADPSGLSPKNVSTAKDLGIITKWILDYEPELIDITLLKSKTIRTHTWTNPTHFLNLTSYAGGKNGYTRAANRTSIALFRLGTKKTLYAIILLGSSARDSDILDLLEEALK